MENIKKFYIKPQEAVGKIVTVKIDTIEWAKDFMEEYKKRCPECEAPFNITDVLFFMGTAFDCGRIQGKEELKAKIQANNNTKKGKKNNG